MATLSRVANKPFIADVETAITRFNQNDAAAAWKDLEPATNDALHDKVIDRVQQAQVYEIMYNSSSSQARANALRNFIQVLPLINYRITNSILSGLTAKEIALYGRCSKVIHGIVASSCRDVWREDTPEFRKTVTAQSWQELNRFWKLGCIKLTYVFPNLRVITSEANNDGIDEPTEERLRPLYPQIQRFELFANTGVQTASAASAPAAATAPAAQQPANSETSSTDAKD